MSPLSELPATMLRQGAQRIAVIGAGISGLSSAWLLGQKHKVTLFEAGSYAGGHTNTVDVTVDGITHPVDTGFLVFNSKTYPNLTALFAHLDVASVETQMTFAVSLDSPRLEWSGSNLATVFGQKRNLVRLDFWRMLADILRFNRESLAWMAAHSDDTLSLRDFLAAGRYSKPFAEWYLLPMAAAIWSCPAGQMLDYPLATFVRFCSNHGLLQVFDRPAWRTVQGGGREYVKKLISQIADLRLNTPVLGVEQSKKGVLLASQGNNGEVLSEHFDHVVFACHSDQALAILGDGASPQVRQTLGAIRYAPNRAVLHTDPALLPRNPAIWSAWNYISGEASANDQRPVSVSYLINQLQPLPFKTPVVVSLNPQREPASDKVIAEFDYAHPVFDAAAIAAQREIKQLNGQRGIWFCGAWNGYGFHEDGLKSALSVANALDCQAPWQMTERRSCAA